MAALRVGAELNFVNRKKLDRPVERHRFDGADKIGRVRGQDFLLPGDQRDRPRAAQFDDAIVILACQEAQREADHAGLVIEHALDGEMRLAGIGGPEDRDEARCWTERRHMRKVRCPESQSKDKDAAAWLPLTGAARPLPRGLTGWDESP